MEQPISWLQVQMALDYLTRCVTELIGTFFFIATILFTGEALPSALALLTVIYFGGKISGGHFNPAVTTVVLVNRGISAMTWLSYVAAQVLGGLLALVWVKYASKTQAPS